MDGEIPPEEVARLHARVAELLERVGVDVRDVLRTEAEEAARHIDATRRSGIRVDVARVDLTRADEAAVARIGRPFTVAEGAVFFAAASAWARLLARGTIPRSSPPRGA